MSLLYEEWPPEEHPRTDSDLCERCGLNAALPDDYLCHDCFEEVESILDELDEQEGA